MYAMVVGAGVVGLTTALLFARSGWDVAVASVATRKPSSGAACALFLPYFGSGDTSRVAPWFASSWGVFEELSRDPHAGVRLITMFEMSRSATDPPAGMASLPDFELVEDDGLPKPYYFAWRFTTWLIDTPIYGAYLRNAVRDAGVQFSELHVHQGVLDSLDFDVVVNCSGHWARDDFQDHSIQPVRGQTIVLNGPSIGVAVGGDEYLLAPRSDGTVVGSLWQPDDTDPSPRSEDTHRLVAMYSSWIRAPLFASALSGEGATDDISVVATYAGVRPYRPAGARVEFEPRDSNGPLLIHNSGHGGSGVALSWGAAGEALRLAKRLCEGGGRA